MKIGRTEKIWLASVLFFWVFYNFPGFPPYGSETACIVHGLISFVGTVLSVYIGCKLTEKEMRNRTKRLRIIRLPLPKRKKNRTNKG